MFLFILLHKKIELTHLKSAQNRCYYSGYYVDGRFRKRKRNVHVCACMNMEDRCRYITYFRRIQYIRIGHLIPQKQDYICCLTWLETRSSLVQKRDGGLRPLMWTVRLLLHISTMKHVRAEKTQSRLIRCLYQPQCRP